MSEETYLFEPEIALYAEEDGLNAYKMIISSAGQYLNPEGKLIVEIGFSQKESILSILRYHNFTESIIVKDIAGHDRVIVAKHSKYVA
jgi:release factor glutamine methyltransferase